ncbi:MAG: hypothetical protein WKG07_46025 [Hymenobacter sp.]
MALLGMPVGESWAQTSTTSLDDEHHRRAHDDDDTAHLHPWAGPGSAAR